jgi:hypothetical protein
MVKFFMLKKLKMLPEMQGNFASMTKCFIIERYLKQCPTNPQQKRTSDD